MAESSKSRIGQTERIPRRPPPEFEETDATLIQGVLDEGFLRVALKDVNQYGPHAMIMLLFIVATVTALALLLSTYISPLSALIIVVTLLSMMGVWFRWRLNPTQ